MKILEDLRYLHPRLNQIRPEELLAASAPIIDERELDETRPSKCALIRAFKQPDYRSPGFSKVYTPREYNSSQFNRKVVAAVEELKARLESRKKK